MPPEVIALYGGQPMSLDKPFNDSDAILILTDHPHHGAIPAVIR